MYYIVLLTLHITPFTYDFNTLIGPFTIVCGHLKQNSVADRRLCQCFDAVGWVIGLEKYRV